MNEKFDTSADAEGEQTAETDLARRLARYRRRIAAEGRPRSLKLIDRAICDAGNQAERT